MMEMGIYLIVVIFSGYVCGTIFINLISNSRYHYNIKNYGLMILYLMPIPLIPILFVIIPIIAGLGIEIIYTFLTGQI